MLKDVRNVRKENVPHQKREQGPPNSILRVQSPPAPMIFLAVVLESELFHCNVLIIEANKIAPDAPLPVGRPAHEFPLPRLPRRPFCKGRLLPPPGRLAQPENPPLQRQPLPHAYPLVRQCTFGDLQGRLFLTEVLQVDGEPYPPVPSFGRALWPSQEHLDELDCVRVAPLFLKQGDSLMGDSHVHPRGPEALQERRFARSFGKLWVARYPAQLLLRSRAPIFVVQVKTKLGTRVAQEFSRCFQVVGLQGRLQA
mmetsp:Transcript_2813/g.7699  ORF Transcript_2813/g.7699 Transcript_2813/m.7699 type:complete len:254 (-) Transcript_2813:1260-2021(-)